jgi:hypothetical protein
VAQRRVDERAPKDDEDEKGREAHALGEGAGDERRGDDGEHALEDHEDHVRQVGGDGLVGLHAHAGQGQEVQAADKAVDVRSEGQGIAPEHPDQGNDADGGETLHHGAESVFGAGHARVEQGQPRGHEHDQGGADDYKSGICRIHKAPPFLSLLSKVGAKEIKHYISNR